MKYANSLAAVEREGLTTEYTTPANTGKVRSALRETLDDALDMKSSIAELELQLKEAHALAFNMSAEVDRLKSGQPILGAIEACKATPGAAWVSVHALTEYANKGGHHE